MTRQITTLLLVPLAAVTIGTVIIESLAIILPPPSLERYKDTSQLITAADGTIVHAFLSRDGRWRLPVTPRDLSRTHLDLLLTIEDRRFFSHFGFDPLAGMRALAQLVANHRIVSGASTITMQVVRLLRPGEGRSALGKLRQVIAARQLEQSLSKQEILAIYLTLAPFGGNIEGVRAASLIYFGKEPARLSVAEAALLIAVPQSPERRRPDAFSEIARSARDRILSRASTAARISGGTAAIAREEPVPDRRRALTDLAPHLADVLRRRQTSQGNVPSFIDSNLQNRVAGILGSSEMARRQQVSAAALVVRNSDGAVMSYVSGPKFFAYDKAGQVDLVRAVRSPGSTLKPLIYGLAFERLLLHPLTIVSDAPVQFGNYEPRNFYHSFQGEMTARDGLINSINTAAVSVLAKVGPEQMAIRLRKVGIHLQIDDTDNQAGLAIALGGCGTTMLDLATLYVALANQGLLRPLRLSPQEQVAPGIRLLDREAAWALTDILADTPAPEGFSGRRMANGNRRIAYKTGTSYSFRDAWAIGYDELHTVAVWVGRADGAPNLGAMGRTASAPLLFQIFDLLAPPVGDVAGPPPPHSILARKDNLPERLQRFNGSPQTRAMEGFRLTFPQPGAHLKLPPSGSEQTLPLVATGGRPPFFWYLDSQLLVPATNDREIRWRPDGSGRVTVKVIDARGEIATADFWLD